MKWNNLDRLKSFERLNNIKKVKLREVLQNAKAKDRIKEYECFVSSALKYNYATKQVNNEIIGCLQDLAKEQELIEKYQALLKGEIINTSENRMVLHHLTRKQSSTPILHNGINLHNFYLTEKEKIKQFAQDIHTHKILSSSNKPFTDVVQVGIGGSDLGPRSLYIALEEYAKIKGLAKLKAHFISNVDPIDAVTIFSKINVSSTLFIIVSKSGTTEETLANEALVLEYLKMNGIKETKKNIIVVTSSSSPLAKDTSYLSHFYIDENIGGRYSSTSACGTLILSLSFGNNLVEDLLQGANEVDDNSLNPNIKENASLLDALIGIYERNVLGYKATAILPYAQSLAKLPAHLQQLDMESGGKSCNRSFERLEYPTSPIIFGEVGTNGQHSFYQFLHQSKEIIPLQFIAFKNTSIYQKDIVNNSTYMQIIQENHTKLLRNLIAQIYAFAIGKDNENKNKQFNGERPSSILYGNELNGKTLGALLAHFENKIMFQGFAWNINSFDQEGVELGKTIAKNIKTGKNIDEVLKAYIELLLD
ncbi:MAG: glucose-6-phosphate isomerase [Treponema sp.]